MEWGELNGVSSMSHRAVGKRIRGTVYVHVSAIGWLSEEYAQLIEQACALKGVILGESYNVVKINAHQHRVSLLHYGDFVADPFPALMAAYTIDIDARHGRKTNYAKSDNPPILHRKELLLAPDNPHIPEFSRLTDELEKLGLFKNNRQIGFRKQWSRRLSEAGVRIKSHRVIKVSASSTAKGDQSWSV